MNGAQFAVLMTVTVVVLIFLGTLIVKRAPAPPKKKVTATNVQRRPERRQRPTGPTLGETFDIWKIGQYLVSSDLHVSFYVFKDGQMELPRSVIYNDRKNLHFLVIDPRGQYKIVYTTEQAINRAKSFFKPGEVIECVFINPESKQGRKLSSIYEGNVFGAS